jgi:hypothetical protein
MDGRIAHLTRENSKKNREETTKTEKTAKNTHFSSKSLAHIVF